ncbi:MarR family transcriptional regulator [Mycobacterium arosiense]|uniref:MarR family transcriptional regulator n=1 Tax=Mycobacterium arosiense ATCC BAA-1401 = DSM 45069 TaxID=1265311 RepID=A0A1W9Z7F4_MYCAI|nr:MarR family transcriptional regulator [Mycobacterium arosiense]ORA08137.1 MarR family transcriptional regulator [Mycobacterium arosiense ATCC BAA-1401 = DSM 45069]
MTELEVLQALRLKGRASLPDLAATLGQDPSDIEGLVDALAADGLLVSDSTLRLSPDGRARLNHLLAEERTRIEVSQLRTIYDEFRSVNQDFKSLIADWQLKDGEPNTHTDNAYDARVLRRLDGIHSQVCDIVNQAGGHLPRLNRYAQKLNAALRNVDGGDTSWLTRPMIDSYHTVWFELHEELILAAGLTRADEASQGHA